MGSLPVVQRVARPAGACLLVLGMLGFVPGVTEHYGALAFAGRSARAELFGLFRVSILHNLVQVTLGVTGLALGRTRRGARLFLLTAGLVYSALWIYGVAVDETGSANVIPVNGADKWLHLSLAVALLAAAVVARRRMPAKLPAT